MYIAQINIARMRASIESELMSEFVDNLDRINSLAEAQNGFVWRLKDEENNATSIKVYDDNFIIINMSVWKDMDSLYRFVYSTAHAEYVRRRKEWFLQMEDMHMAMWHIEKDSTPTVNEAKEKLEYLRLRGETKEVFSFKSLRNSDYTQ